MSDEEPTGSSQPIRRASTMPAPRGLCVADAWEYLLHVLAGWEAGRDPRTPHFIGDSEKTLPEILESLLKESRRTSVTKMSGHACPLVFGTMRTSKALIQAYIEIALRMPGMHSPLNGLRLASDGESWKLQELEGDLKALPPFARVWRSGQQQLEEARKRAGKTNADQIIMVQLDQVPYIIDWMCMEAQRLDPILRAIFDEQP